MVLRHLHVMTTLSGDMNEDGGVLIALVWHVHNLFKSVHIHHGDLNSRCYNVKERR